MNDTNPNAMRVIEPKTEGSGFFLTKLKERLTILDYSHGFELSAEEAQIYDDVLPQPAFEALEADGIKQIFFARVFRLDNAHPGIELIVDFGPKGIAQLSLPYGAPATVDWPKARTVDWKTMTSFQSFFSVHTKEKHMRLSSLLTKKNNETVLRSLLERLVSFLPEIKLVLDTHWSEKKASR